MFPDYSKSWMYMYLVFDMYIENLDWINDDNEIKRQLF